MTGVQTCALPIFVLGDHQPASSVSGKGAPWDVPVHVIASRSMVTDALRAEGFRPGLEPRRPVIGPMHALTGKILRAFGGVAASTGESVAAAQAGVDVGEADPQRRIRDETAGFVRVAPIGTSDAVTVAH